MKDFKNLCMSCMNDMKGNTVCPSCGYNNDKKQEAPYLPKGTLLEGRYVVGKLTDKNSEGVGYIGYDTVTETPVYIREFLPLEICTRSSDGKNVEVTEYFKAYYRTYMDSFLKYFRSVARKREISSIVTIYNIFSENNTAYTVSELVDGVSLTEYVMKSENNRLDWDSVKVLFMPVLSALIDLERSGVRHLGICPDSLIVTRSGKMRLTQFSIREIRMSNSKLTPNLIDGCSAVEQYTNGCREDESTDIYGFTASLFFALTGELPENSLKRKVNDRLLIQTKIIKDIPQYVLTAMANALRVAQNSRTMTFERLRMELSSAHSLVDNSEQDPITSNRLIDTGKNSYSNNRNFKKGIISFSIALIVLIVVSIIWLVFSSFGDGKNNSDSSAIESDLASSEYVYTEASENTEGKITVPDLASVSLSKAKEQANATYEYKIVSQSEEYSDDVAEGCIISQNPEAGTSVNKGTSILVVVSKGPKMRQLPEIKGLTLSEASLTLTSAGFEPQLSYQYSDTVEDGIVIGYESNNTGDSLEKGSKVNIVVSKGRE